MEVFIQSALWKPLICLVRSRVPNDQLTSQQNGKQILQGQESRQPLAFPKSHKPEKKQQSSPHIQQTQTKQGCAYWLFPCRTSWLWHTHVWTGLPQAERLCKGWGVISAEQSPRSTHCVSLYVRGGTKVLASIKLNEFMSWLVCRHFIFITARTFSLPQKCTLKILLLENREREKQLPSKIPANCLSGYLQFWFFF